MSTDRPSSLLDQANEMVAQSRWRELHELLAGVPRPELFTSVPLAYRYAEALYHLGRMAELTEYASEFESAMRRQRGTSGVMQALNLAGIAAFELGRMEEARQRFESLMELAEAEGDTDMLARATNNLGALANLEGRHEDALALYHLAIPLYQKLGQTRGIAQTHQNLGISYRDLGRWKDAAAAYQDAAEYGRGFGYTPIVAMAMVGRGEIEVLKGDPALGAGFVEWGLEMARELEDPITEGTALRVRALARAAGADGGYIRAYDDLEAALELGRETGHLLLQAEVERDMGRLVLGRGLRGEARRLLADARQKLQSLGAERAASEIAAELRALNDSYS
jgi:tetratricopeptide (TPR) repeat protein